MATYAISDLHLSFGVDKPMNIFGEKWDHYEEKIANNWKRKVTKQDVVILPGDISWGMTLKETKKDFEYIDRLPGKKIILKGNHDYYFSTKTKIGQFLTDHSFHTISIFYNDAMDIGEYILAGTRGWGKTEINDGELNKKIIAREELRLRMSLEKAKKLQQESPKDLIVALHFPPFIGKFCEIMQEYQVKKCMYGHLHGYGHRMIREGVIEGIEYIMVSCDYTKFDVVRI